MGTLLTAMVTPYDANLQVDYKQAAALAEYLYNHGSEGLVVGGTTGESPVLSAEEKLNLFAAVQSAVGDKMQVWGGTGSNNTAQAISLSQEADKLGLAGVMLVSPYYNKPSQEGLYQHFKAIAAKIHCPVMVYNIPSRTGCNILPDTMTRLAEIENITCLKESSGDMDQMSWLRSKLPEDFIIYSGDDSLTLPMLALGAQGVVSIASHIVGDEMKAMLAAWKNNDIETARKLHLQLMPVFKGLFINTNPTPLKAALKMMGLEVGGLRLPLCEIDDKEKEFIRDLLTKMGKL
jgi:4-hydroxy-tetrahydrodipicolinate synthase